jgi:hypothetical protein
VVLERIKAKASLVRLRKESVSSVGKPDTGNGTVLRFSASKQVKTEMLVV